MRFKSSAQRRAVMGIITNRQYKRAWKDVNGSPNKPYIVVSYKKKPDGIYTIPRKTFNTIKEARSYIRRKTQ